MLFASHVLHDTAVRGKCRDSGALPTSTVSPHPPSPCNFFPPLNQPRVAETRSSPIRNALPRCSSFLVSEVLNQIIERSDYRYPIRPSLTLFFRLFSSRDRVPSQLLQPLTAYLRVSKRPPHALGQCAHVALREIDYTAAWG